MAETPVTSNLGWDNFFSTTTTGALTPTTTTIPLATPPTPTEGFLVLDPGGANEIIFYNSVSGNSVIVPTTDDRGRGDSTAQDHSSGITVKMNTVGMMFEALQSGLALTASAITPEKLLAGTGTGWAQQSWTPTLTNFTLGNGTKSGSYVQMGKMVFAEVYVACDSTTAFGTDMFVELPVNGASKYSSRSYSVVGHASLHDSGTKIWDGVLYLTTDNNSAQVRYLSASAAPSTTTATTPFTIANGDTLQFSIVYEAA